jgi:hypothetical protein
MSRIDVLYKGQILVSRVIKSGFGSLAEALKEGLNEAQLDTGDDFLFESEQEGETILSLSQDMESREARDILDWAAGGGDPDRRPPNAPADAARVFDYLSPAADRLIKQLDRTLAFYYQRLQGEPVEIIYHSGLLGSYAPLFEYIGRQMNLPTAAIDPLSGADQEKTVEPDLVEGAATQTSVLAMPLGLAVSDIQRTPNLLYTFKEKQEAKRFVRVQKVAVGVFLLLLLILGGTYWGQRSMLNSQKAALNRLEAELDQYQNLVTPGALDQLLSRVAANGQLLKQYARKYHTLAVVSDLVNNTPDSVMLRKMAVKSEVDSNPDEAQNGTAHVKLEGVVIGDRQRLETVLAEYLLSLESKPLFAAPRIDRQEFIVLEGQELLEFVAQINLENVTP